jgi:hypothetical protein
MTHYESIAKLRQKLSAELQGGALFPDIILEDSKLPLDKEGKLFNAGDNEDITLKKIPDPYGNPASDYRFINIFPAGKNHPKLHLECYYNDKTKDLYIKSINTEYLQSSGIGTYLFSILFNYLQHNNVRFKTISLVFYPTIQNPAKKENHRIQTPEVLIRGMQFYFKVFSLFANFYPMVENTQITTATIANLQKVIDDYNDADRSVMVFKRRR